MGMFDRVWVRCPDCGEMIEFQSKASNCLMDDYDLECAPLSILQDISSDTEYCENCGSIIGVELIIIGKAKTISWAYRS